jgi:hypothetical protein
MWNMCTKRKIFKTLWKRKKKAILSELCHEQRIVDNAAERGNQCCGTGAGKRMFKDLWLGQRSAGLGGGGSRI